MVKVLFVDDDPGAHRLLQHILPKVYTLLSARTGQEGLEAAAREAPDVVLLDIDLPDIDGIAVLRELAARPLAPPVVMLTGLSSVRLVKEAIQAGACDYVVKPYGAEALLGTLASAVRGADARRRLPSAAPSLLEELIGETAGIREAKELILRYGPVDCPVLVRGESGTGKELVARALHRVSPRCDRPLVAVNCGALPEALLETELFGSEKGAFTDAVSRPGSFERADGGTLFLDEVGELSPRAQTGLLRVLEEKELTRVGGSRPIPVDARVVSATNTDLKAEVREGGFREDLYWRLAVLPIRVPPLRDRKEDIPLLAAHFLALRGQQRASIAADARDRLIAHPWPGNIRELRNVMERAALSAGGETIRARDIQFD
ncbi:MAG: sigma-54 dependent transcriptional regulator [Spirochaetes bacterium]|nr:sigma-54 dependent transcriptional regulator [Spirochaetota bacterium]